MPEPAGSETRLLALRRRWETEKSTAFLPLAEEYRRLGRLREAIEVLEIGLKSNPGYTSGLVALGRCRLESGDSGGAVAVLERVVAQDPEQLVASKLLIEAYLRTGREREARARLDVYARLNSKDPEIARLRDRLVALAGSSVVAPPAAQPMPPAAEPAEETTAVGLEEIVAQPPVEPAADALRSPPPAGENLFVGLDGPAVVSRYLRGLAVEGIFPLAFPQPTLRPAGPIAAEAASTPATASVGPEPVLSPFEAEVERAIAGFVATSAAPAAGEPAVEEAEASSAVSGDRAAVEAPAADAAPMAAETATLGDLYLRQGHAAEAERIFGAVLERDPANDGARRGLDLAQEALRQTPGGLSARRANALRAYLERLRGGAHHVS